MSTESARYRATELGKEARCSRCGEFWPCDEEFFFMRLGVPHSWCKACYLADPKILARKAAYAAAKRQSPGLPPQPASSTAHLSPLLSGIRRPTMSQPKLCNACETVAHCTTHGCIPATTKPATCAGLIIKFDDVLNNLGWKMNDWLTANGATFDGRVFNNMKSFLRECIQEWHDQHAAPLAQQIGAAMESVLVEGVPYTIPAPVAVNCCTCT